MLGSYCEGRGRDPGMIHYILNAMGSFLEKPRCSAAVKPQVGSAIILIHILYCMTIKISQTIYINY